MGKISVKHYFNDRLKSESINGQMYNPVYVQIIRKQRTYQLKSGLINEKITAQMFESAEIKALCKKETELINSFFCFAENFITDFQIKNSKTSFGNLLELYCNYRFFTILEWAKAGFITAETENNMSVKLR
ncbi:MAG: hypothetical protein LBV31_03455, partial [Prevotellaceae bacterium]|nr:hypothetical protein [Prevotellaceae bacterium]